MIYTFLNFELDCDNRELLCDGRVLPLSVQNVELLQLLAAHPGKVFSREQLMQEIWSDRIVTQNSLDQSLSRIRKVLSDHTSETCIETVYGKGFRFHPEVTRTDSKDTAAAALPKTTYGLRRWLTTAAAVVLGLLVVFALLDGGTNSNITSPATAAQPLMLFATNQTGSDSDLLDTGLQQALGQMLNLSLTAQVRYGQIESGSESESDSGNQWDQQWRVSPDLNILTTNLDMQDDQYVLSLQLLRRTAQPQMFRQVADQPAVLISAALDWLDQQLDASADTSLPALLLPQDDYTVESYLRGQASLARGEIDQAGRYFELCLSEKPDFSLARLGLARVRYRQGDNPSSLAALSTLETTISHPGLRIEIAALRGDIYDSQGEFTAARDIYLGALDDYQQHAYPQLNDIRYNLSYTLANQGDFNAALQQLGLLESNAQSSGDQELLAQVFQKQGSLLLQTGQSDQAIGKAQQSLALMQTLDDSLGQAKVLSLLGRLYRQQLEYDQTEFYLLQALSLAETMNYPLGIGATLNELIDLQIARHNYTEAASLNQRMQDIGLQIDYAAMVQTAIQHSANIARLRQQWQQAEQRMDEHLAYVEPLDNPKYLIRNQQLRLDYHLDRGQADAAAPLITSIEDYIRQSSESSLQGKLDYQKARLLLLQDRTADALRLLQQTVRQAQGQNDRQVAVESRALLAEYYLEQSNVDSALDQIEIRTEPVPAQYQRLAAHAYAAENQPVIALEWLHRYQSSANEAWNHADERLRLQLEGQLRDTNNAR